MMGQIVFAPLVWPEVLVLALVLAVALTGVSLWRGMAGWWLRGLTALALVAALANPSVQSEDRDPLSSIALVVVDETASNRISTRPDQTDRALDHLTSRLSALEGIDQRVIRVQDDPDNTGSLVNGAIAQALTDIPRDRLAGVFVVGDGQVHDADSPPDLPTPLHLLQTGEADDWDRRLIVQNAPGFAILGEPVTITLRVEDQGAVPPSVAGSAELALSLNGDTPRVVTAPIGQDLQLQVTLEQGGMNVLQFELADTPGELTTRNNAAVIQINGVRDRLSVLLVSGEPNAGQRTWRNLLKSDASVDLVHFTILRPPDRQDGVPVNELSLIAFPTRELFVDKIEEFDLIIFDRYRRRGILPNAYFDNIRQYVENGGALLVVGGPEFAGVDSIWRSALGEVFPAYPTARVLNEGFTPRISDLGQRHPVTEGLEQFAPAGAEGEGPGWGRWLRQIEVIPEQGQVVMQGVGDRPLLVLDRVAEGRVALLASDQAWLWDRGFEGGGPQLELLRRLAHWMMAEPELEEESLTATAEGNRITIARRTLSDTAPDVTLTAPDGGTVTLGLTETTAGLFSAEYEAADLGLYRLSDGTFDAVVALGPSAPREFEDTIATPDRLGPLIAETRGGVARIEDGLPDLRLVGEGREASGRGWLGVTQRDAYITTDVRIAALLPVWLWLLLAAGLALGAWLREGRR
ncbi:glutamine amidotransferase [Roseicitreum antarcticum]|uniref:Glutamine amidotransferase domain-containing protein n=1 Tax=Roseicitreum antarcticum TaxID=564137 RepID=A0A1H3B2L0_9RHOB|nr:glutamine amidotransferase [Roseicitreum antarcticum]SDX35289.1 hypothetical protein SAMN04488238_107202 [Roseicitreum antarcticum]